MRLRTYVGAAFGYGASRVWLGLRDATVEGWDTDADAPREVPMLCVDKITIAALGGAMSVAGMWLPYAISDACKLEAACRGEERLERRRSVAVFDYLVEEVCKRGVLREKSMKVLSPPRKDCDDLLAEDDATCTQRDPLRLHRTQ